MNEPPWKQGDTDIADEVYAALEPLDGFPRGSRGGPRPYRYQDWWVIVSLSDFGDVFVGQWGPIAAPPSAASDRVIGEVDG